MDRLFPKGVSVSVMAAVALAVLIWCLPHSVIAGNQLANSVTDRELYCPTSSEDAREAFNLGREFADKGQMEQARKSYLIALSADPSYCDAMDNLGLAYRAEGKLDSAIYWYRKSIEVHPDGYVAFMNLGVALRLQGHSAEAIDAYRNCIRLDSLDPEGYYGLGSILIDSGEFRAALPLFVKCEALYRTLSSPFVLHAQYFQGICYANLGEWSSGIEVLAPIYEQIKDDATANYCLGLCYLKNEPSDREKSIKYLKKAKKGGSKLATELLKEAE
jgi:tetratricopeptide (TPR) repeat protein